MVTWRKSIQQKIETSKVETEKSRCKGPEAGLCLVSSRNKKASVAEGESAGKRVMGLRGRGETGQATWGLWAMLLPYLGKVGTKGGSQQRTI